MHFGSVPTTLWIHSSNTNEASPVFTLMHQHHSTSGNIYETLPHISHRHNTSAVWSTSRLSVGPLLFTLYMLPLRDIMCVCVCMSAVWSTSRLSTRTVTFHALHVTLGKYHQETWGYLSLLCWWYSALYFFTARWNKPNWKTYGMHSWYKKLDDE